MRLSQVQQGPVDYQQGPVDHQSWRVRDAARTPPFDLSGSKDAISRSGEDRDAAVMRAVAAAKRGEGQGIHFLYVSFAPSVQRYVRGIVADEHEAEDITQQVFAKLMVVIDRYEERGLPFAAWILRVARNAALDHIRASRVILSDEVQESPASNHAPTEAQHERRQTLHDAFARLPEDQAKVVWLRHVVGLTPPEIAAWLGRSESSIHGLHHRGRGALRADLAAIGTAPSTRRRPARIRRSEAVLAAA